MMQLYACYARTENLVTHVVHGAPHGVPLKHRVTPEGGKNVYAIGYMHDLYA
jgi:hypothetical protein